MKKILLLGCDVPGWGGAATVRHLMLERMQRHEVPVASLTLLLDLEEAYCRFVMGENFLDPVGLPDVHLARMESEARGAHPDVAARIQAIAPDLILAFGLLAAHVALRTAPGIPVVLMTMGSQRLQELVEEGVVRDFLDFERAVGRGTRFEVPADGLELEALQGVDLVLVHSPLVRSCFEQFYPEKMGKVLDPTLSVADLVYFEAERFAHLRRPFSERSIDVLFVASHWSRPVKNATMVRDIAARLPSLALHVAGDCGERFANCVHHGVVTTRDEMYRLLGDARVVAVPSSLDAAPGVLFEGAAMGCNVVASRNCGNWELCHADLLVERFTAAEFAERITRGTRRVYADHHDLFRGGYAGVLDAVMLW